MGSRRRGCAARESRADDAAGGADAVSEADPQSDRPARGGADLAGRTVSGSAQRGARLGGRATGGRGAEAAPGNVGDLARIWRRRGSGRGDSNDSRCARQRRRRARQRSAWRACAGSRRGVRRCSLTNSLVVGCAIGEKSAHSRAWSRRRIGVARSSEDQGVTPSGLPAVRRIAVEIAWAWLRYQPTSALAQMV